MINILENTLRDGSYALDFQTTREQTYSITKGLNDLGFEWIEVGHGLGLGASRTIIHANAKETDEVYMKAAREAADKAKVGTFFIPTIGTKDDLLRAKDHGMDFIRVGNNVDRYRDARGFVEYANSLGLTVFVNLMKSYGVKTYEFTKLVSEIDRWGAIAAIYLVDSAGCMLPDEVFEYIERTRDHVQTKLGFHGHNNLSMAMANTIAAVKAGASFVDTCIRGMGRSAGNAQTEIAIHILQKLGIIDHRVDLYELYDFSNSVVVPMMPRPQGLTDEEIHIGVSKFHTSFMPFVDHAVEATGVDKRKLIKRVSEINCINPSEDLFLEIASSRQ